MRTILSRLCFLAVVLDMAGSCMALDLGPLLGGLIAGVGAIIGVPLMIQACRLAGTAD